MRSKSNQRVGQMTTNQKVGSSNLSGRTIFSAKSHGFCSLSLTCSVGFYFCFTFHNFPELEPKLSYWCGGMMLMDFGSLGEDRKVSG